jgi:hypothetical protein
VIDVKKVRKYNYQRKPRGGDKMKMKFTVPPEMLQEEGINTKEPMPVTMEVTVPKDIKEKKQ